MFHRITLCRWENNAKYNSRISILLVSGRYVPYLLLSKSGVKIHVSCSPPHPCRPWPFLQLRMNDGANKRERISVSACDICTIRSSLTECLSALNFKELENHLDGFLFPARRHLFASDHKC
jgi:hypothetical protein